MLLRSFKLPNDCTLSLFNGSVLDFEGDAIINAANNGGVTGFGLDEMVIRLAGDHEIKKSRRELNGIATGDAKVISSFNRTKVRYIIHAVPAPFIATMS